jgi:hypothetical protein
MTNTLFQRFAPIIRTLSAAELNGAPTLKTKLLLAAEGNLEVCYAPLEYVNPHARIVLVGITPGLTQMVNSIKEARRMLDLGAGVDETMMSVKRVGAFSGSMRKLLVDLLDYIQIHRWLGISTSDTLFGTHSHLVQTTSVLRNPVFRDGGNYNGAPDILRTPLLREQLFAGFVQDATLLPDAVYVPLGPVVCKVLEHLVEQGLIKRNQVLSGLPHPSPANQERIAVFMKRKAGHLASIKTDVGKLERARESIQKQVSALAS